MNNKFMEFCKNKTECILIILFVLAMILSAVVLFGCKQSDIQIQEQNLNRIKSYEDIRIAKINIVTAGEIKNYTVFSDLVLIDEMNDFIGFVYIKRLEDGVAKPCWKQYRDCTYLIESTSVPATKDETLKEVVVTEYNRCRGVFQINEFLYKHDQKEKERR